MKIKDLYDSKEKWTQQHYARNQYGGPVGVDSWNACSFCLIGATLKCYPEGLRDSIIAKITNKISCGVARWNDHPDRTFEEVRTLVAELDI